MSILQDLDPQYAKIHQAPSTTWKPAIWAISILLAAGGGYWLMTNVLTGTPSIAAPLVQSTPAQEKASANPPSPSTPRAPTDSSATITDIPKQNAEQRETGLTKTPTPGNTADSLADGEFRRQKPPASPPGATKHASGKAERHKTATPASVKNERVQTPVAKRASERDVDIITAIVR